MNIKDFNFNGLNLGEKIILIGCVVSVISLFLPWVDIAIISENGFQQDGFIVILFWLYPCIQAIRQQKPIKKLSLILVGVSIVFMVFFIHDKSTSILGQSVSAAASGMYVMTASLIAILVGSFLNDR